MKYHKCVVDSEMGLMVIGSRPDHVLGCMGHVDDDILVEDYPFLVQTEDGFVVDEEAKMAYILENMNESVSE